MEILHADKTFNKNDNNNDMDHNKKSGNNSIEIRYKAEVDKILDKNHLSLTPKVLDSSLDLKVSIKKEDIPFDKITG
ncbi:hypothetical protein C1645_822688 [Glomus cerebriforme]|uniref:Uncharacterized protein n=1 Tax=Glomus cerebriforme TaxID=658196 RepID=A0A397SY79_9GLOM|nr:hypothetical protein C1645_822688 [Glomus cerebriforme]